MKIDKVCVICNSEFVSGTITRNTCSNKCKDDKNRVKPPCIDCGMEGR